MQCSGVLDILLESHLLATKLLSCMWLPVKGNLNLEAELETRASRMVLYWKSMQVNKWKLAGNV